MLKLHRSRESINVGDRDPAHYRDAAHRAQPAQKQMLEIVDLSN